MFLKPEIALLPVLFLESEWGDLMVFDGCKMDGCFSEDNRALFCSSATSRLLRAKALMNL